MGHAKQSRMNLEHVYTSFRFMFPLLLCYCSSICLEADTCGFIQLQGMLLCSQELVAPCVSCLEPDGSNFTLCFFNIHYNIFLPSVV
jgi:hypothetical protein